MVEPDNSPKPSQATSPASARASATGKEAGLRDYVCAIPGRNDAQSTHAHEKSYDAMLQDDDPRPREHFACPWDSCILKAPYVSMTYAVPALATRAIPGRLLRATSRKSRVSLSTKLTRTIRYPCVVFFVCVMRWGEGGSDCHKRSELARTSRTGFCGSR
jgi:hypothetical protein